MIALAICRYAPWKFALCGFQHGASAKASFTFKLSACEPDVYSVIKPGGTEVATRTYGPNGHSTCDNKVATSTFFIPTLDVDVPSQVAFIPHVGVGVLRRSAA